MTPESNDIGIIQNPGNPSPEPTTSPLQAVMPADSESPKLTDEFPVLRNTQELDIGMVLLASEIETLKKVEEILADLEKQPENPRRKVQALGTIVSLLTSIPDELEQQIKTVSDKPALEQEIMTRIEKLLRAKQEIVRLLEGKKEHIIKISQEDMAQIRQLIAEVL